MLTEEGSDEEGVDDNFSKHEDDEDPGIAMRSSRLGSSDSGGNTRRHSWPRFAGEAQEAGGVEKGVSGGDPLAAALLPRGRLTRGQHRRQGLGLGEEAWVVAVRVEEEAYMTFLGGETQVNYGLATPMHIS